MYSFILIMIITLLISLTNWSFISYITSLWWWILLVYIGFSYANFIVFVLKVRWKARMFKSKLENSKKDMIHKCQNAEKEVQDLMTISKMSADLNSTPFGTLN